MSPGACTRLDAPRPLFDYYKTTLTTTPRWRCAYAAKIIHSVPTSETHFLTPCCSCTSLGPWYSQPTAFIASPVTMSTVVSTPPSRCRRLSTRCSVRLLLIVSPCPETNTTVTSAISNFSSRSTTRATLSHNRRPHPVPSSVYQPATNLRRGYDTHLPKHINTTPANKKGTSSITGALSSQVRSKGVLERIGHELSALRRIRSVAFDNELQQHLRLQHGALHQVRRPQQVLLASSGRTQKQWRRPGESEVIDGATRVS